MSINEFKFPITPPPQKIYSHLWRHLFAHRVYGTSVDVQREREGGGGLLAHFASVSILSVDVKRCGLKSESPERRSASRRIARLKRGAFWQI